MKIKSIILIATMALCWPLSGVFDVCADLITVTNYSFELPDKADGVTGWPPGADGWYRNLGDDNFFTADPLVNVTNQTGDQYLRAYMNPGGLTRTELELSNTFVFAANTLYTLTVDMTGNFANRDIDAGFFLYDVTDASTVATYTTNLQQMTPYTFLPGSLTFSTLDHSDVVGNDYTIRLFAQHNENHGRDIMWDNVRLDATVIPEPATLGMALAGLFSLRFMRRRRSDIPA